MTKVAPLYSTIIRNFSAPNFLKTLSNSFPSCPFIKNDYHRIVAVRPLHTVVASPRHRISARTTVGVRFSRMSGSAAADSVVFHLSPSSALKIQKGDITRWSIDGSSDAIVRISMYVFDCVWISIRLGDWS